MKIGIAVLALAGAASLAATGCGQTEKPYEPKPAYSGDKRPKLPTVPALPNTPKKDGDAYTVYGAQHDLLSIVHGDDFKGKEVSIVGYIVATNYDKVCGDEKKLAPGPGELCVPMCAIHKGGKADPDGCKAPIPSFWIGDQKDSDIKNSIRVMGWASNFAQIYDLVEAIDKESDDAKKDAVEKQDNLLAVKMPVPIPVKGAKVKVTGAYAFNYDRGTQGRAADPLMGIITYASMQYVEKAKERAALPGMKTK